jgi:hypothetical protein
MYGWPFLTTSGSLAVAEVRVHYDARRGGGYVVDCSERAGAPVRVRRIGVLSPLAENDLEGHLGKTEPVSSRLSSMACTNSVILTAKTETSITAMPGTRKRERPRGYRPSAAQRAGHQERSMR